jgi:hypothetical protein
MMMPQFNAVTDRPAIIRSMASKRRRELISTIVTGVILVAGLAYILATNRISHGFPMLPLLALLLVAFIESAFSLQNSRCPACDAPIGTAIRRARFCPRCGTQLVPDEKLAKPAA